MLLTSLYLCKGVLWIMLIVFICSVYAYYVNARRKADDPQKKDFYPGAILLAPITWPAFLFAYVFLFILKALLYGVFLILFTIALVAVRKPFIFILLDKMATYVGSKLLEANTLLIKLFLRPWADDPQPI
jgi:hypothetical protein